MVDVDRVHLALEVELGGLAQGLVSAGLVKGLQIKDGHIGFSIEVDPKQGAELEPMRKLAEEVVYDIKGVISATVVLTADDFKKLPEEQSHEIEVLEFVPVEQVDPIWVTFTQPASEVMKLRRAIESGKVKGVDGGARVHLFIEDGREYEQTGKLLFSDMTVDPTTGAITLRAQFPNPKRELLSGTFVRVKIEQGVDENALTVPQRALIRNAQGASVMVVGGDGNVAAVPVKAPQAIGESWIVTEGLKGGEKVIVTFSSAKFSVDPDVISLQPGEDVTVTVRVRDGAA